MADNWRIELGRIYSGMTLMQRLEWFALEAQNLDQLTELGKHGIPTMARSAFDDVMDYQNYERAIAKARGDWEPPDPPGFEGGFADNH